MPYYKYIYLNGNSWLKKKIKYNSLAINVINSISVNILHHTYSTIINGQPLFLFQSINYFNNL